MADCDIIQAVRKSAINTLPFLTKSLVSIGARASMVIPESILTTNQEQEEWRSVVGYEGRYEVSSLGRVKSMVNRLVPTGYLKALIKGKRYLKVTLNNHDRGRMFEVHCLVAAAFLGPRPADHEINHKDCNKQNNFAGNLEYLSELEHKAHTQKNNLMPCGEDNGRSKLTEGQVLEIKSRIIAGEKLRPLAREFGVTRPVITDIRDGNKWKKVLEAAGYQTMPYRTKSKKFAGPIPEPLEAK